MRAIPIGFVPESIINSYATINADATHPHPKSTASSIIIARATEFLLLKSSENTGIIPYCLGHVENIDEETSAYLRAVDELGVEIGEEEYKVLCGEQPTTSFPEGIYGLPSDAMRLAGTALYIIKHAKDTFDGLKKSVLVGGDIGTLAPVVVGILAGKFGLGSLPKSLFEVENQQYIAELGNQFAKKLTSVHGFL